MTLLEQGLDRLFALFDDVEVLVADALGPRAQQDIRKRRDQLKARRMELEPARSLNLDHRLDVLEHYPSLHQQIGFRSRRHVATSKKSLQRLRDHIAHSGSLTDIQDDIVSTIKLVQATRQQAERTWWLVSPEQAQWTMFAFAEIRSDEECLAGPGAVADVPFDTAWVITAENPEGRLDRNTARNAARTRQLLTALENESVPYRLAQPDAHPIGRRASSSGSAAIVIALFSSAGGSLRAASSRSRGAIR